MQFFYQLRSLKWGDIFDVPEDDEHHYYMVTSAGFIDLESGFATDFSLDAEVKLVKAKLLIMG